MADSPSFHDIQYRLAAHIRDPRQNPAPKDVEDRRIAIYRDLFFNNISGLLAGTYPVVQKILGPERWQALIRSYFSLHKSHTPYFLEISRDFLGFLENERPDSEQDPPFLLELAHYEWVELALSVAEIDADTADIDPHGDLLDQVPVVSPLAQVLRYRFPVHAIGPDFQPLTAPQQPTWLVVVRNNKDKVVFLHVNEVTARLLALAADGEQSGRSILETIALEMQHEKPEVVVNGGQDILQMLREKDIILGTRRQANKE